MTLRLATPGRTLFAGTRSTGSLVEAGRQNSENIPPRNNARLDLKLLWLHGRIKRRWMASVAAYNTLWSMLWSTAICGHMSDKYFTLFLQSDWAHNHCGVLHKSMY